MVQRGGRLDPGVSRQPSRAILAEAPGYFSRGILVFGQETVRLAMAAEGSSAY